MSNETCPICGNKININYMTNCGECHVRLIKESAGVIIPAYSVIERKGMDCPYCEKPSSGLGLKQCIKCERSYVSCKNANGDVISVSRKPRSWNADINEEEDMDLKVLEFLWDLGPRRWGDKREWVVESLSDGSSILTPIITDRNDPMYHLSKDYLTWPRISFWFDKEDHKYHSSVKCEIADKTMESKSGSKLAMDMVEYVEEKLNVYLSNNQ